MTCDDEVALIGCCPCLASIWGGADTVNLYFVNEAWVQPWYEQGGLLLPQESGLQREELTVLASGRRQSKANPQRGRAHCFL